MPKALMSLVPVILQASLFLAVLAVGLRAEPRDPLSLLRDPSRLLRAAASILLMPLVAVLVALAIEPPPAVTVALVTLALAPVAPLWPGQSLKAAGRSSYTVGLLTVSALASLVVIPVGLGIYERLAGVQLGVPPLVILRLVVLTLLVPLFVGIYARLLWPSLAGRIVRGVGLVSSLLIVLAAVPLVVATWPVMAGLVGNGTLAAMVLFVLAGMAAGHLAAGHADEERTSLALAAVMRHPGVAVAIMHAAERDLPQAPPAVLLYLLVSLVVSAPYKRWSRRAHAPVVGHPARAKA